MNGYVTTTPVERVQAACRNLQDIIDARSDELTEGVAKALSDVIMRLHLQARSRGVAGRRRRTIRGWRTTRWMVRRSCARRSDASGCGRRSDDGCRRPAARRRRWPCNSHRDAIGGGAGDD